MSLGQIVEIIHSSELQEWKKRNEDALKAQFGGPKDGIQRLRRERSN